VKPPSRTKYIYRIRSRNGAIVENLQIYGKDAEDAKRKLMQMYINCEILEEKVLQPEHHGNGSFEDVINLIVSSES
jgi:hypothetical protein